MPTKKMMLRDGLSAFLTILLLGCATPAERAAHAQAEVEELIKVYSPACEKLGYKPDTDLWRDCILRLAARDDNRYRDRPRMTTCTGQQGLYNCMSY